LSASAEHYFSLIENNVVGRQRGFELPSEYINGYGKYISDINWPAFYETCKRLSDVFSKRHRHLEDHVLAHGRLPSGPLSEEHKTGIDLLDLRAPPSVVGDWIRRLGNVAQIEQRRKLEIESDESKSSSPSSTSTTTILGTVVNGIISGETDKVWSDIGKILDDRAPHAHQTRTRRLFETAAYVTTSTAEHMTRLSTTVFGPGTGTLPSAQKVPGEEALEPIRHGLSYIVYDALLCYLYAPSIENGGDFGDGTTIQTFYSHRACFPFVPYIPPPMAKFADAYNFSSDFQWATLEYDQACDSAAVQALIGPMKSDLSLYGWIATPYASILRVAEGVDAIRNLAPQTEATTDAQRGAAIACGLAQFGGVLYLTIVIVVAMAACLCAPVGTACCAAAFGSLWSSAGRARDRARERKIERILKRLEKEEERGEEKEPLVES